MPDRASVVKVGAGSVGCGGVGPLMKGVNALRKWDREGFLKKSFGEGRFMRMFSAGDAMNRFCYGENFLQEFFLDYFTCFSDVDFLAASEYASLGGSAGTDWRRGMNR